MDFWQGTVRILRICLIDSFILLWYNINIKISQYNSVNAKVSISQLNRLKSATKNEAKVTLKLLSNMIGNSANETNFLHKLLLTGRLASELRKNCTNNLSANIKLSKIQLSKIISGFLDRTFGPLLKTNLPLMKNVFKPVAKSVLIPLQ